MGEQFVVSHHAAGPGYYNIRGGIKKSDGRPVALDTVVVDAPTPPLNAKGMGESTIVPVGPAIANAVYNAIGIRIKSGPITPDRDAFEFSRDSGEYQKHLRAGFAQQRCQGIKDRCNGQDQ
jgi:hypothetical protein